jgi:hypothetical protein
VKSGLNSVTHLSSHDVEDRLGSESNTLDNIATMFLTVLLYHTFVPNFTIRETMVSLHSVQIRYF